MTILKTLKTPLLAAALSTTALWATPAMADQVFNDDVIVDGSLCVGFDCVNGESFGSDTLRLKENNLRINFQDTSTSASFPSNDWRITINDSSNGGGNYFAIEDATGGRIPFRVEAGAPSHSLYVEDGGRVGFGTNAPVVELHAVDGDTPTLRLAQDGSSGFNPQTWDMAGNETNFFIRDVTNGSTLPFRIRPNAPTSSIDIAADGDVGFGTTSPTASLHVQGSDSSTKLLVEETSLTSGNQTLLQINNNGGRARMQLIGGGSAPQTGNWIVSGGSTFVIQDVVTAGNEMIIDQSGNVTILGALTENSDINSKTNIIKVDAKEILNKVAELPVSSWTYKNDLSSGIRHIGPMAQDFYAAFGTGRDENGISTIDTSGVALAAIQALEAENNDLRKRIEALESRN